MAGHSKWKNIRLHKGKADAERGKLFAKLSREIIIAARNGGGVTDANPRLRLAVDKARDASMPMDNINRAIKKGTGELGEGESYDEVTYEGYGPGGVAVLVECATDKRTRTVADIRHLFSKYGGNMGENGSVAWQFDRKGIVLLGEGEYSEDAVMEVALEAGAEDLRSDGGFEVVTSYEELTAVRSALEAKGFTVEEARVEFIPQVTVPLDGDAARKMLKLMDALEDHDDVQRVAANFDIADSVLEEING